MSDSDEESLDLPHHMPDLSDSTQRAYLPLASDLLQTAFSSGSTPEKKKYACRHYQRRCMYVSPCCNKVYACRFCHDGRETHKINRHAVSEIVCLMCGSRQPVNRYCSLCGVEFGRYFCSICRLFDDKDRKQFHCDQCGICRVHGRENFFHCPTCDTCLCIALKDSHKCVENVTHANCSVCLEDLHTSRDTLAVLSCGHIIHRIYACPLCCHSMIDMNSAWHSLDWQIAHTPMPEEYRGTNVTILCRDCHKITSVPFHVMGLKCHKCGSYNTCRASPSAYCAEPNEHNETSASASTSAHGASLSSSNSSVTHRDGHV